MASVHLYIYDLSNGMAKSLSLSLLGKHIEAIWFAVALNSGTLASLSLV